MTTIQSPLPYLPTIAYLIVLLLLTPFSVAQITVEGKVMNNKNNPVGGVDVAIYVPGSTNPVVSQKTDSKTGEYRFLKLQVTGAFDIMYTHSMYDTSTVSRLAEGDNQHVSKVIYLKGQPKAVTALHEQFLSTRRLVFLAVAIDRKDDRTAFVARLADLGIWEGINRKIDDMSSEKLSDRMRALLETEQRQTLSLRSLLQ